MGGYLRWSAGYGCGQSDVCMVVLVTGCLPPGGWSDSEEEFGWLMVGWLHGQSMMGDKLFYRTLSWVVWVGG